ncbi:hypothetical protein PPYR_11850 [Photinus pyralis]|uniref:DDE Tnp4 domain-containing protein n=1 Tax=Photinus pyralis TaxID=7054 RepID=A0A5N4ACH3_PHOPY|nr:hypothetical protein PPYR_11850 [Photinus pyralis]
MNQLLLTLRLYATGNMLIAVGDFSGVHKSTACRIVKKVTAAICTLSENYIRDSGYAIQKYLITPLLHPNNDAEQLFNEAQIRTRNPIERLFGVLKRRFPILSIGIRIKLQTAQQIIIACATLHNLARARNEGEPLVDPDVIVPVIDDQPQNHVEAENPPGYPNADIFCFNTTPAFSNRRSN